jgi:hypothetical protein
LIRLPATPTYAGKDVPGKAYDRERSVFRKSTVFIQKNTIIRV